MTIENFSPTLFFIGSGGVIGFVIGIAIKKVMKFLAVEVGVFLGALIYLQSQSIININWDKLLSVTQSTVIAISTSLTGTEQISTIAGNLGIPLTGGLGSGICYLFHERLTLFGNSTI